MDGWATPVAWQHWATWVQDLIMRQMGWPLPQGDAFDEAFEAEADDAEQEEGFHEIDINGELFRVSCDGVREVEKAMLAADCLRLQLAPVRSILEYVCDTAYLCGKYAAYLPRVDAIAGDDVESLAAWALCHVDELLRQQADQEAPPLPALALESMKLLQRHLQDIALLACGRLVSKTILQSKGIQHELLSRIEAAFGQVALQSDSLWSRLGNSKYHMFTPGVRFGERKHRHGRGGRSRRLSQNAAEDVTAVASPIANLSALGEPMSIAMSIYPEEDRSAVNKALPGEPMSIAMSIYPKEDRAVGAACAHGCPNVNKGLRCLDGGASGSGTLPAAAAAWASAAAPPTSAADCEPVVGASA